MILAIDLIAREEDGKRLDEEDRDSEPHGRDEDLVDSGEVRRVETT